MDNISFHEDGSLPHNDEVFVFGSNLAGIHGAGAALIARQKFGALYGIGSGYATQGRRSYAIPTKDYKVDTLPLPMIERFISIFLIETHLSGLKFFVTRVGCGLAGYRDEQIAPLFSTAKNCSFAEQWRQYIVKGN